MNAYLGGSHTVGAAEHDKQTTLIRAIEQVREWASIPFVVTAAWFIAPMRRWIASLAAVLVLQLSLRVGFALMALPVTVLGHGLMDAPPLRPAEEMIEHYAGRTLQAANELADLAHAEGDQRSRLRSPLLCDVTALSFTRRAARKPKASMASVMCRYQPCQERIS